MLRAATVTERNPCASAANSKGSSMLNSNQMALVSFVDAQAAALPVSNRIKVYRGLADTINDRAYQLVFLGRAEILEEAERKCSELKFSKEPTQ